MATSMMREQSFQMNLRRRFGPRDLVRSPASGRVDWEQAAPSLAVWLSTLMLGFGVPVAVNLWLLAQGDATVHLLRSTLTYRSALVGDGLILPLVNVLIFLFLREWRQGVTPRALGRALLWGGLLTVAVHIYQGAASLVNWTMPTPFRWTVLGYYHALFFWGEVSVIALFCGVTLARLRKGDGLPAQRLPVLAVLAGLSAFVLLLVQDYATAAQHALAQLAQVAEHLPHGHLRALPALVRQLPWR